MTGYIMPKDLIGEPTDEEKESVAVEESVVIKLKSGEIKPDMQLSRILGFLKSDERPLKRAAKKAVQEKKKKSSEKAVAKQVAVEEFDIDPDEPLDLDVSVYLKEHVGLDMNDRLILIPFRVDLGHPHLKIIDEKVCRKCEKRPCLFGCPVENYTLEGKKVNLSWEGCLECGACRVVCPYDNIEWNYPRGGYGVCYKFG